MNTSTARADVTAAVDALVVDGLKALADYDGFTQEQIDHIVKKASVAALSRHGDLARLAVEETGRTNNLQWFKVPPKTYFEPNAIRYLADMPDVSRVTIVTIVTDPTMTRLGYVDRIRAVLRQRPNGVTVQILDNVEPEPTMSTVDKGAELMRSFRPDTIIALGGGSPWTRRR